MFKLAPIGFCRTVEMEAMRTVELCYEMNRSFHITMTSSLAARELYLEGLCAVRTLCKPVRSP